MNDSTIIKLLKQKNIYGLGDLINKYKRLSCSVALTILGSSNIEDALECVNDTFYDIWRSFDNFDEKKSSLKGWIALITRRRAIDMLRKNSKNKLVSLDDFTGEIISGTANPEESVISDEHVSMINKFVKQLPEKDRDIFIRRFFMLESINSIASHEGMNRSAVDNHLSNIRKKLNNYFEGSEDEL